MSCACMNRRIGQDLDRIRRLAKAFAQSEGVTVAIYKNGDGTYNFVTVSHVSDKQIIEYVTPY